MESNFVLIHKQFPASAEYLSSIYLIKRDYGYVANTRLAEWMGVSSSAVTQALGRLKRFGLVRHKRYKNVLLSTEGRNLAVRVLRRHYLLEHLLVRVLEYPWAKADEEAKLLQTEISDDLAEHLYVKLGSPQACPHGNPMPGSKIEKSLLAAPKLSEAVPGATVKILRITEEGEQIPSMLAFCQRHGLQPGVRFLVKSKDKRSLHLLRPISSKHVKGETSFASFALQLERAQHVRCEPGVSNNSSAPPKSLRQTQDARADYQHEKPPVKGSVKSTQRMDPH